MKEWAFFVFNKEKAHELLEEKFWRDRRKGKEREVLLWGGEPVGEIGKSYFGPGEAIRVTVYEGRQGAQQLKNQILRYGGYYIGSQRFPLG
ncbi:hypothetical protein J7J95_02175 [bacterium]|nr:hypothetical protein [bacterium]